MGGVVREVEGWRYRSGRTHHLEIPKHSYLVPVYLTYLGTFPGIVKGWLSGKLKGPHVSWDRVTMPSTPRVLGRWCINQGRVWLIQRKEHCQHNQYLGSLQGRLGIQKPAQQQAKMLLLLSPLPPLPPPPGARKQVDGM